MQNNGKNVWILKRLVGAKGMKKVLDMQLVWEMWKGRGFCKIWMSRMVSYAMVVKQWHKNLMIQVGGKEIWRNALRGRMVFSVLMFIAVVLLFIVRSFEWFIVYYFGRSILGTTCVWRLAFNQILFGVHKCVPATDRITSHGNVKLQYKALYGLTRLINNHLPNSSREEIERSLPTLMLV